MYYLCSENKGADQLRGYREVDLRLCYHICKRPVFSRRGSYVISTTHSNKPKGGGGINIRQNDHKNRLLGIPCFGLDSVCELFNVAYVGTYKENKLKEKAVKMVVHPVEKS